MCSLGNGQGRGQWFVKRQTEGIGLRSSTTGKDCGRSHHRSSHHCLVVQKGRGLHCTPFPHMLAPTSMGTRRGTHIEQASLPLKPKPSLPMLAELPVHSSLPKLPLTMPAPRAAFTSFFLVGCPCSGAILGADIGERNTHRGGAQTTAEPLEQCN